MDGKITTHTIDYCATYMCGTANADRPSEKMTFT